MIHVSKGKFYWYVRDLFTCAVLVNLCTYSLTLKVGATPIGPLLLNAAINNNNNNNNNITPTTSLPAAGCIHPHVTPRVGLKKQSKVWHKAGVL